VDAAPSLPTRDELLARFTGVATTLNNLDEDLRHGNVLAAQADSELLRMRLVKLTRELGL
jgi:hypothetical protein